MKQSPILAIDSATSVLRVGLQTAGNALITAESRDRFRHAEFILGLIEKVLKESGIAPTALGEIVVSLGPGSFTGLRVGLATAKGLALSLGIPLLGMPLLEAVAGKLFSLFGATAVVIPSRREEFYLTIVDSANFEASRLQIVTAGELKVKIGPRAVYPVDCDLSQMNLDSSKIIGSERCQISIGDYIEAGRRRRQLARGYVSGIADLEPLYIQVFPAQKK